MSFIERVINVTVGIGKGNYGEDGFEIATLAGYRCSVEINRAAMPWLTTATVRVHGMSPTLVNQLSTLGGSPGYNGRLNTLQIQAGDADAGMTQVFDGVIINGYQDYSAMPDVCFVAEASVGALDLVKPAASTSFPDTADVATILKGMAARMTPPLNFVNNGVSQVLGTPYFPGTLIDQIRAVIRHANINAEISNGTLTIWPRNGSKPGTPTTVSPATGLVGYPSINGVEVFELTTLFNPAIEFGSYINLQSSLTPACGTWYVNGLSHRLESLTPGGAWFSDIQAASKDYITALPPQ